MNAPPEFLSAAALRRAFAHNKENHGCGGADAVTLGPFERELDSRIDELRAAVSEETYWAWPLRRVEVEKRPGSQERRTLLVASVRDRVLQTAVAAYLEPYLEAEFDDCSFGFRRGRGVRLAVERVQACFRDGYKWLVDGCATRM